MNPTKAIDLQIGNIIEYKGGKWKLLKRMHVKPGKGPAYIQAEFKNIITNTKINERLHSDETLDKLSFHIQEATFLYRNGDQLEILIDATFETISLPVEIIGENIIFLEENMKIGLEMLSEEIIGILLPDTVVLEIIETSPYIKGQTITNSFKSATCNNSLVLQVPPFIEIGEKIIVKTIDGSYVERLKNNN
jgi:elongation factor P